MIRKEIKLPFNSPVTICDIEISNDLKQPNGSWDYGIAQIITLGVLYGNNLIILQKEQTDSEKIWKYELIKLLEGKPLLFSLNTKMEQFGLKGYLGKDYHFDEIQPFRGSGCTKGHFFDSLLQNNIVKKEDAPQDPFNDDSKLVIPAYLKRNYEEIIGHNTSCLIKEYYIFMNRFWFLEKYKDFYNDSGWWCAKNNFGDGEPEIYYEDDDDGLQQFRD